MHNRLAASTYLLRSVVCAIVKYSASVNLRPSPNARPSCTRVCERERRTGHPHLASSLLPHLQLVYRLQFCLKRHVYTRSWEHLHRW